MIQDCIVFTTANFHEFVTNEDKEKKLVVQVLKVCHSKERIVDENAGALHVHSVVGEGTAVTVFFPIAKGG